MEVGVEDYLLNRFLNEYKNATKLVDELHKKLLASKLTAEQTKTLDGFMDAIRSAAYWERLHIRHTVYNQVLSSISNHLEFLEKSNSDYRSVPPKFVVCRFCGRDCDASWDAYECVGGYVCNDCEDEAKIECEMCGKLTHPLDSLCYDCGLTHEEG
jgi:hypothetical protein